MRARTHIRPLALVTLVWFGFWLAGLPLYCRQYSTAAMIAFCVARVPVVAWLGIKVIGRRRAGTPRVRGLAGVLFQRATGDL